MAVKFDNELLQLDDDESKKIAKAIVEVQAQYPAVAFDPKHAAIMGLIFVLLEIEGPRAILIWQQIKQNRKEK